MITDMNVGILNDVLDNRISNLEPEFRSKIYNDIVMNHIDKCGGWVKLKSFILKKYMSGGVQNGRHTAPYWEVRGWSRYQAEVKSSEHLKNIGRVGKGVSPFSFEFWITKINEDTNQLYTPDEALFKARSQNPHHKEYWLKLGHNEEESIQFAKERINKNSKKGTIKLKKNSPGTQKNYSKRSKEYWMNRGYSELEAEHKVSEHQISFSREKCITKYGEEGLKIWQDRQDRWMLTMNSKPESEKKEINKRKMTSVRAISKAEQDILQYISKCGIVVSTQETIGRYVVDFVFEKKIVEYFGDFWHCNPAKYIPSFLNTKNNKTASEIWNRDEKRIAKLHSLGYDVLIVWESDYNKNKEQIMKGIVDFLIS